MGLIYQPKGRAGEYAKLAVNLYVGCSHRCVYCYVPDVTRNANFFKEQKPKADVIEKLRKEVKRYRGTDARVLLCFSCDPYQPLDSELGITRQALQILDENEIPFQVLTKGGLRAARDFDLYTRADAFAVTLTATSDVFRRDYEPGAATPADRIESLKLAKKKGIETWVSLEPVIVAVQSLRVIEQTYEFVDHYKIGVMNRLKVECDWRAFGQNAIELCEKFNRDYFIKHDLAKHLHGIRFTNTDRRCSVPVYCE